MTNTTLCACPFCKKQPTINDVLKNVKQSINHDVEIFELSLIDTNLPFDMENQKECTFKKGEGISFTVKCPNCTVKLSGIFRNQFDDQKNSEKLKEILIKEWNSMSGTPKKDHCPKCKQTMDYDEYEFIYPTELAPAGDNTTVFNYTASCDAGGCGCGFEITFKSNRENAKAIGEELWSRFYL